MWAANFVLPPSMVPLHVVVAMETALLQSIPSLNSWIPVR